MKARINFGGFAFPSAGFSSGMTLRDYFAGQALVGILGSGDAKIDNIISDEFASATLAQSTYIIADAMLAARERKEDAK